MYPTARSFLYLKVSSIILIFSIFLLQFSIFSTQLSAQDSTRQTVGLVLSGGGAKGLAYIGILRALEEANIPIDYVAGTSMGGIIGGFYAAGYSPAQLEEMVLSEEFLDWINGNIPEGYDFYFTQPRPTPSTLSVELKVKEGAGPSLSTFLASDLSLNFTLATKLAQANAISGENFDSLFIPYRTTASEVFAEESMWISKGKLNEAIRATMSVPLFYRPIKLEDKYVFDGGIYNNFPVDSMQATFQPDVIIGANVSDKTFLGYPSELAESLVPSVLLYAMLRKTDSVVGPQNIYMEPHLEGLSALDFDQAPLFIERGYEEALAHMEDVKAKIRSRRPLESVKARRTEFWADTIPLKIGSIQTLDIPERQSNYILKYLQGKDTDNSLSSFKRNYYRLASEPFFKQILPEINYDQDSGSYTFNIGLKAQDLLEFRLGILAASRGIGYIYADAEYTLLRKTLTKIMANGYAGDFYTSAHLRSKTFFPGRPHIYIEPSYTYNNRAYENANDFLFKDEEQPELSRIDRTFRFDVGIATGKSGKWVASGAYFFNSDKFLIPEYRLGDPSEDLDHLKLQGLMLGITYERSSLNRRQYASEGSGHQFTASYISGRERFTDGAENVTETEVEQDHQWLRFTAEGERYFTTGRLSLGYHLKAYYANLPEFSNYFSTLLYAGEAEPFTESSTRFQTRFRSNAYGMAGFRLVWKLENSWDYRIEGYFINRVGEILPEADGGAKFEYQAWNPGYALTAGLVYHSIAGPVAVRFNYLDSPQRNFQFLFHVGYIFHNQRLFE